LEKKREEDDFLEKKREEDDFLEKKREEDDVLEKQRKEEILLKRMVKEGNLAREKKEHVQEEEKKEKEEQNIENICDSHSLMTKLTEDMKEKTNCIQPDLNSSTEPGIIQPESTLPIPNPKDESCHTVEIYVNMSYQVRNTLEKISYILDKSAQKMTSITSVKIAKCVLKVEEKQELITNLQQMLLPPSDFAVLDPEESFLHKFRVRIKSIDLETREVKIRLEIPVWQNLIQLISSQLTKLGTNNLVEFYPPCITIESSDQHRPCLHRQVQR
jgi:hypothetical protein